MHFSGECMLRATYSLSKRHSYPSRRRHLTIVALITGREENTGGTTLCLSCHAKKRTCLDALRRHLWHPPHSQNACMEQAGDKHKCRVSRQFHAAKLYSVSAIISEARWHIPVHHLCQNTQTRLRSKPVIRLIDVTRPAKFVEMTETRNPLP